MTPPLVLVVDDHADNRTLVSWILELEGLRVAEAATGDEALAVTREQLPDLVLMDLELPGIDGWEVTRLLGSGPDTAHIPVVAITAHAQQPFVERALQAGCVSVIKKPFLPEELPGQVWSALRGQDLEQRTT